MNVRAAAVPTVVKELGQLNGEGVFLLDRDALAMLAAVDGRSSVAKHARLRGLWSTAWPGSLGRPTDGGGSRPVGAGAPCT